MQSLKKIHAWAQMKVPLLNTFQFLFTMKCWLSGLQVRIANREDPDQIAWWIMLDMIYFVIYFLIWGGGVMLDISCIR